jgi:hypothetical protein
MSYYNGVSVGAGLNYPAPPYPPVAGEVGERLARAFGELEVEQSRINVRRHELHLEAAQATAAAIARPVGAGLCWADFDVQQAEIELDRARLDARQIALSAERRKHEFAQVVDKVAAESRFTLRGQGSSTGIDRAAEAASWKSERTAHIPDADPPGAAGSQELGQ